MNRQDKTARVAQLNEILDGAQLVVLTEYAGLAVSEMVELRQSLRQARGRYRIVKNTLARIATADTELETLGEHFKGPVAIAVTEEDAPGTAKALVDFAGDHPKLLIKAGLLRGGKLLDVDGVKALSKLPGKDELRSMFVSTLAAPARNFVSLMAAPARNLAGVLEARRRQLAGE